MVSLESKVDLFEPSSPSTRQLSYLNSTFQPLPIHLTTPFVRFKV